MAHFLKKQKGLLFSLRRCIGQTVNFISKPDCQTKPTSQILSSLRRGRVQEYNSVPEEEEISTTTTATTTTGGSGVILIIAFKLVIQVVLCCIQKPQLE